MSEGSSDDGKESLQFHNCGIIDDEIWFYGRISLHFMSSLPTTFFSLQNRSPSTTIDNHLKLLHVSIFKLYFTPTMSFYYQYFINIIFILLEMRVTKTCEDCMSVEKRMENMKRQRERDAT